MRREWARPYDADDLARIAARPRRASEHGVELVYCISPGLSIRYSSAADADALIAKLAVGRCRRCAPLRTAARRRAGAAAASGRRRSVRHARRGAARTREHASSPRCVRSSRQRPWSSAPPSTGATGTSRISSSSPARCIPRSICSGPAVPSARPPSTSRTRRGSHRRPAAPPLYWDNYPGQRRGDGARTARRALPRAVTPARRGVAWCDRERHGAVRVVEDRVRHDRRLPVVATGLRSRGQLGCRTARRGRCGGCRRLSRLRRQRPVVLPQRPRRSARDRGARGPRLRDPHRRQCPRA